MLFGCVTWGWLIFKLRESLGIKRLSREIKSIKVIYTPEYPKYNLAWTMCKL